MEVIVAAALFAISLLVLMGIFPISTRAVRKAQVRTIAARLVENQLERTRAASFNSVSDVPPFSVIVDIINNGNVENVDFRVEQQVTTPTAGLKHVRVTVSWKRESQDQSIFLETDLANTSP